MSFGGVLDEEIGFEYERIIGNTVGPCGRESLWNRRLHLVLPRTPVGFSA